MSSTDTIAALATPPGRGGVGIIRISGPLSVRVAESIVGSVPTPRNASFARFRDGAGELLDEGLVIYFSAPHSFTGEDVVELQGHGGPVVMDLLLQRCLKLGARLAEPGEFSRRAFLNDKLDLLQAEAIADLIDAESAAAAKMASRTLQGVFSRKVHDLVEQLTQLRLYVESSIDFPEEEIDFLSDGKVSADLQSVTDNLGGLLQNAHTGRLLRDGMTLVIAGRPNAGKSSLLNALAGYESAIVTEFPGTTRDILRERISIDGLPLHIVDTAGIHDSTDPVEAEGIRRARHQIEQADRVLWVFDDQTDPAHLELDRSELPGGVSVTLIRNKIDLTGKPPAIRQSEQDVEIAIAAREGLGLDLLIDHLKACVGYQSQGGGEFIARRRHLDALERALDHLRQGADMLAGQRAGELLAEDLRQAQQSLSEITGEFSADDLLGRIFSTFCIGK
ncbi:MAG: tRNA uridine-5-carboxymethylaminomethyl(34) synthesis GTPase MnmE [Candidatus Thiodiazotropha sp.]